MSMGCTSLRDWVRHGFKVGPEYCPPAVPIATEWIDVHDGDRLAPDGAPIDAWWCQFGDPILSELIAIASDQNLTLQAAGTRILQARAARGIAAGNLCPQQQEAYGGYARTQNSLAVAQPFPQTLRAFDQWEAGLNLAWEVDFWGRFRRGIEAADAQLQASVEDYHSVLVLLLAEVADNYVQLRSFQTRLELAQENVKSQKGIYDISVVKEQAGAGTMLDVYQAELNLRQTESTIPVLETGIRTVSNRLCILVGIPPRDLAGCLRRGSVPSSSQPLTVGVPADLLRRRPDVRKAERLLAAQCARIGIAEADLYPQLRLTGVISWQAQNFHDLFQAGSLAGAMGPSFRWNILNYGRIRNTICAEQARFDELLYEYQQTVLRAHEEVENAIVGYVKACDRQETTRRAVQAARHSERIVLDQYQAGRADFNRVFAIQAVKVVQQDELARVEAEMTRYLIQTYRALGGGWIVGSNCLVDHPSACAWH